MCIGCACPVAGGIYSPIGQCSCLVLMICNPHFRVLRSRRAEAMRNGRTIVMRGSGRVEFKISGSPHPKTRVQIPAAAAPASGGGGYAQNRKTIILRGEGAPSRKIAQNAKTIVRRFRWRIRWLGGIFGRMAAAHHALPRATKNGLPKPSSTFPYIKGVPSVRVTVPPAAASTAWPAAVSHSMVRPWRG